jgi:hypothetical protein
VTAVEELSKMQRLSLGRMDRFEAMIEDLAMRSFDNLDMRTFHDLAETYPLLRAAAAVGIGVTGEPRCIGLRAAEQVA